MPPRTEPPSRRPKRGVASARRPRTYEIRTRFRAPLRFVYRWCTDYTPGDAQLEHESYERRVLSKTRGRVVYEDLDRLADGWAWRRTTVTLRPPSGWHADSVGNRRTFRLDYRLRELRTGGTELWLRGIRRPTEIGAPNPPPAEMERELRRMWRDFGRALERDYRASLTSGAARRRRRPSS
jgi:hypothetical protein